MFCYKDQTFCGFISCTNFSNEQCHRALTPERKQAAESWWESFTGTDTDCPISLFGEKPDCYKGEEYTDVSK